MLNGAIAGVVGYRIASLTSPHRFDRIVRVVAIGQYAVPIGVLTIVFRSWALPRLFIPALLTLTAYTLTSIRESSAARATSRPCGGRSGPCPGC